MDRLELIKTYLTKTPEDSFLNHALAMEYIKLGRDADAIGLLESLLARDPDYVGSYYHLGGALERTGNLQAARAAYQNGISAARRLGDDHALRELEQAANALED